MRHSSTSTYTTNFIEIEETICGRTDGRTFETDCIRSTRRSRRLGGVDLIIVSPPGMAMPTAGLRVADQSNQSIDQSINQSNTNLYSAISR